MTSDKTFWAWFKKHEDELFQFNPQNIEQRDRLFNQLASQLSSYYPGLAFEFGPVEDNSRQFVISADGNRKLFPAVLKLVGSAPKLSKWRVVAFRPRHNPIPSVSIDGVTVNPEDVQFSLLSNGQMAGIQVFIPGMSDNDSTRKQIAFILLDSALGEYDVETKIGLIEIISPSSSTEAERFPFRQLPKMFDRLLQGLPNGA